MGVRTKMLMAQLELNAQMPSVTLTTTLSPTTGYNPTITA